MTDAVLGTVLVLRSLVLGVCARVQAAARPAASLPRPNRAANSKLSAVWSGQPATAGDSWRLSAVTAPAAAAGATAAAVMAAAGTLWSPPATPVIKYHHCLENALEYDGGLQVGDLPRFVSSRVANGQGGSQPADPDGTAAANWVDVPHRQNVLLLNDVSFDEAIGRSPCVLVFFYTPWCVHCSNAKRPYALAAHELAQEGLGGRMAAVDISSNPLLEQRFRLEYFPAFKLFLKGEFKADHHRLRTKEEFLQLMKDGDLG